MNKEQILHKLEICNKISPKINVSNLIGNRHHIHQFVPNVDNSVIRKIQRYITLIAESYTEKYKHDKEYRNLYHKTKGNEFGYFISRTVEDLYAFIKILGYTKICDLGCGYGVALKALKRFDETIQISGYDNEPYLIKLAEDDNFVCKDITILEKGDVKIDQIIFMWEPFIDKDLSTKFVNNMANIAEKGQIIVIGECPELTVRNLLNNKAFEYVCNFGNKYIFMKV